MPAQPSETEAKARAQRGRGRLSSLEMLPEAADEALAWANAELRERRMPQAEILRRMNAMLADHGIAPVSVGAFSRHSIRLAIEMRKLEATRAATTAVLDRLPKGERSDATQAAVELVKFRLAEMIMAADDPDPKFLASASLALMRLTSTTLLLANAERQDRKDQREQDEQEVVFLGPRDGQSEDCRGGTELELADNDRIDHRDALGPVGNVDRRVQVVHEYAHDLAEAEGDDRQIIAS